MCVTEAERFGKDPAFPWVTVSELRSCIYTRMSDLQIVANECQICTLLKQSDGSASGRKELNLLVLAMQPTSSV